MSEGQQGRYPAAFNALPHSMELCTHYATVTESAGAILWRRKQINVVGEPGCTNEGHCESPLRMLLASGPWETARSETEDRRGQR
jgi:hypothetical protein